MLTGNFCCDDSGCYDSHYGEAAGLTSDFSDILLVEKQIVSSDKVNQALTEQNIHLGEILVDADLISLEQLDQVLGEQYLKNKKLGELLLEKKLVTSEQLEMTLRKQYWQKNGFWLIS